MKPVDIYEMTLSELNCFMEGIELKIKNDCSLAVLTGYYTGYYVNGGKKARPPKELIDKMNAQKQNLSDGLREIERIKELEKGGLYGRN